MMYFNQDFIDFFAELASNNHKAWFDENRGRYEKNVKVAFKQFVTDLILEIQKFDPEILIEAKNAIFRINRDVRFSKNKNPYKNNVGAYISRISKKEEYPGYYVQLDAEHLWVGGGLYELTTDSLYKVRQEILYNEAELKKIIEDKAFKDSYQEILGAKNKILKTPFKEHAVEIPYLLNKQFYFMQKFPISTVFRDDLTEFVANELLKAYPLNRFLRMALEEGS
ncbi:DUF2461 domain-containing protein [Marivirga sp. S37H4]|uniref:DUF2461 domain-containing protein n=1 Tax=Marivirga aurantiaca TaxID=2802615 RepID=A0A934WZQ5_9BACT|nr:DUF2461 domain-containing protein [Marivirga aurantiaca]MBK6265822.1 DUF2461 domain-containing protein [Marivirga aurantiaca]